ncbi:hypothetical protein [Flindersiella endophytica]
MSGTELSQWFASPAERQHSRDLAAIERQRDKGMARIRAIAQVADFAMMAGAAVTQTRNQAERIVPDGAEKFAMIDTASTAAIMNVVIDMGR